MYCATERQPNGNSSNGKKKEKNKQGHTATVCLSKCLKRATHARGNREVGRDGVIDTDSFTETNRDIGR